MGTLAVRGIPQTFSTAVISLADSGDLVAAVTGKRILVWEIMLTNSDSTKSVTFKSAATGLTGAMLFESLRFSALQPFNPTLQANAPLFETEVGEAFVATLSAAANLAGRVVYSEG